MASNLAKAINSNAIYCTINNVQREWRDFLLRVNHIYGYSPELKRNGLTGLFVLYQVKSNYMVLYCARQKRNEYVWKQYVVEFGSRTTDKILEVRKNRIGNVVIDRYDFSDHYNPRIVTEPFMPMPHMRIPMGSRTSKKIILKREMHDYRAKDCEELRDKYDRMQVEAVLDTLDAINRHRDECNSSI